MDIPASFVVAFLNYPGRNLVALPTSDERAEIVREFPDYSGRAKR